MQRSVLLGAGAAVLIVAGGLAVRAVTRQQAGQTVDQTIDQVLASLPPGTALRHGATDYNPLTGTLTLHDVAYAQADGARWTAAKVAISNANGQALREVFDPAAYPQGHPAWTDRRLLVGEAVASTVHGSLPGATPVEISIDQVTLHRLSGHPFATPPTPEARATPGYLAASAEAFAFDREESRGLSVTARAPQGVKMTVGSAKASGYDAGKTASLLLANVAIDAGRPGHKPVHVTLDEISVKDADARSLLQAAGQGPSPARLAGLTYAAWDATGLALQVPQGPLVTMRSIHAQQAAPDGQRQGRVVVTAFTLGLGETVVPSSAAPSLAAFGMNAITTDITAVSHGQPPGQIELHEDLALHDLGTLHLVGTFEGYVAPQSASGGVAATMGALMGTTMDHASVVWDDVSLTDRVFKMMAVQEHSTPELVRGQLAIPLVALGVMLPDQPDAATQVSAFLDHPHRLTVTMAPTQPVVLGDVARAPVAQRAHLLGVHVSGE